MKTKIPSQDYMLANSLHFCTIGQGIANECSRTAGGAGKNFMTITTVVLQLQEEDCTPLKSSIRECLGSQVLGVACL